MVTIQSAPPAYHVLVKSTGAVCNLDCKYCFFLSKELLYQAADSAWQLISWNYDIEQLLESHRAPEVNLAWQG